MGKETNNILNEYMYNMYRDSMIDFIKFLESSKSIMVLFSILILLWTFLFLFAYGIYAITFSMFVYFPIIKYREYSKKIINALIELEKMGKENGFEEKELKYCNKCIQMTNHIENRCLKCGSKQIIKKGDY